MSRKGKTRKEQARDRGRSGKKAQYRVRNWAAYNESLKQRGSVEVWISEEALGEWEAPRLKARQRGRPPKYSDGAIECLLTLKAVFCLPLRATEGFGRSLVKLLGAEVAVPDYTTLSRRSKRLKVDVPVSRRQDKLHIVVDSTGLKVYGEGEWKVRKHGPSKRRIWRKLHLSINADTLEVEAMALSEAGNSDGRVGSQMVESIPDPIDRVTGDGAYDTRAFYESCHERNITHVIVPPRRTAHIWQHGNSAKPPLQRDENLRAIRRHGRKRWKQSVDYHRRSLVETSVYRFKTLLGGTLMARLPETQLTEARVKCRALNIMTQLGMPDSVRVA
jgi:hypothetical protein